MYRLMLMTW